LAHGHWMCRHGAHAILAKSHYQFQSKILIKNIHAKRLIHAIFGSSIEMNFFLFTRDGFLRIIGRFHPVTSDSPNT
jgi:hypothetical protein